MDNWLPLMKAGKQLADPYLSDDEPSTPIAIILIRLFFQSFELFLFLPSVIAIQRKPSIEVSSSKRKTHVFDPPKCKEVGKIKKKEARNVMIENHVSSCFLFFFVAPGQRSIGEIKLTLDHDPDGHTLKVIIFGVKG